MTLKLRILRSLTRLFIILVSLRRSLFSEKMLTSTRCIGGLMSNLIEKSWTDSSACVISWVQAYSAGLPKQRKTGVVKSFKYILLTFCLPRLSLRFGFCLFLANDSKEHSQLNTIKCDYNGHTLATVHSVVCKVEVSLDSIPSPSH